MENNFDIPSKGVEKIPAKTARELVDEAINKIADVPIPVKPETPKLGLKEGMQVLKSFLINEGAGLVGGKFGGIDLYIKVIIVLGIILAIIFA